MRAHAAVAWGRRPCKVNGMSQERKSFTVSDRRHFTSDGEPRDEERAAESPDLSTAPGAPDERVPADDGEPADLSSFVLSLAAQAGHLLSSQERETKGGLAEARYIISILEMLEDKTRGRRTDNEDKILHSVLYELRMGYVARARAGGA
jgi:hypothetical protein